MSLESPFHAELNGLCPILYIKVSISILKVSIIYCILLIFCSKDVLLFHGFTSFIPKKLSRLPDFTSFHSIQMQTFTKKLS